MTPTSSCL